MSLTAEEYYELIDIDEDFKELKLLEAYDDFWEFCLYMDYEFFRKREKILKQVAEAFQEIEEGKLDLLYVGMPPRTGKSYITSLWCAWMLGRHPTEPIMRNTVTGTLYNKFSTDIRDIMRGDTHKGRYLDVFSNIQFATEKLEGWKLTTSQHGVSYFGAGVGGTVIGLGCTIAAILDDSIKNAEEAISETVLDKKWNWYTSTHKSRMEKGCPEIHIATRWSKGDIPGRLIEEGEFDGKKAKKIIIPALIDGKSYCEEIHSTKKLLKEKRLLDDIIWSAEWQQDPVEAKGLLFPSKELNYFEMKDLNQKPDGIILAGDIADEGDDSLCCPLGYVYGDKVYIVDVIFTTDPIEVTQPRTAAFIDEYRPDKARFESNNGGKGFAMKVKELIKAKTTVKWEPSTSNKHTRIIMKSGYIKENFYFRKDIELGSEYDKYMKELNKYNKLGKVVHDDAPDATTMLAEMMDKPNLKPRKRKPTGF